MSSHKLTSLLQIAAVLLLASLTQAHAAENPLSSADDAQALQASPPDETRVATDLKAHSLIASITSLSATPNADAEAKWTTIRSSVRKGEVLEFRTTSLYYSDAHGQPQREVDSVLSYEMSAGRWTLRDVQVTDARDVQPDGSASASDRC
jgi:hypothetical protein